MGSNPWRGATCRSDSQRGRGAGEATLLLQLRASKESTPRSWAAWDATLAGSCSAATFVYPVDLCSQGAMARAWPSRLLVTFRSRCAYFGDVTLDGAEQERDAQPLVQLSGQRSPWPRPAWRLAGACEGVAMCVFLASRSASASAVYRATWPHGSGGLAVFLREMSHTSD